MKGGTFLSKVTLARGERSGSRREMGWGVVASLDVMPFRCAALRNPDHGSRKLSTLNRKAKLFERMRQKVTALEERDF